MSIECARLPSRTKQAGLRSALIAGALLSGALGGCGGASAPSLSAFRTGFATQKQSFHRLGLDLQQAIATAQNKSDAQLASEIGALAQRAKAQASSLAQLNPPGPFKANLHQLEAGFNAVSADLSQIATAATKHDRTGAQSATVALIRDASSVKTADTAISSRLSAPAKG